LPQDSCTTLPNQHEGARHLFLNYRHQRSILHNAILRFPFPKQQLIDCYPVGALPPFISRDKLRPLLFILPALQGRWAPVRQFPANLHDKPPNSSDMDLPRACAHATRLQCSPIQRIPRAMPSTSLADLQNISKFPHLTLSLDLHPIFSSNASGCAGPPHPPTSQKPRGGPAPRQILPPTAVTPSQSSRHYSPILFSRHAYKN
jgi:hypothetical protein